MPPIKLNSSGVVILKNGSPSCTCCGCDQCDPATISVNWEWINTDPDPDETDSGTASLTISPATVATFDDELNYGVPEGSCIVVAPFTFGIISGNLIWSGFSESWSIDATQGSEDPTTRCNPSGVYTEFPGAPVTITISIMP
jgi:hypothetical protein